MNDDEQYANAYNQEEIDFWEKQYDQELYKQQEYDIYAGIKEYRQEELTRQLVVWLFLFLLLAKEIVY